MSGSAPSAATTVVAPTVTAGPWRKILIYVGVIGGIGLVFVFSSAGNLPFLHRHKPGERPLEVQMNGPITRLDKPVEQHLPPPARPAVLTQARVVNAGSDDDARKAAEAPLSAYSLGPTTGNAPPAKVAQNDPDELPAGNRPDALEASLQPAKMDGTRVAELPNPRWLIEQGRVLPCTQQTRIDSTLPGAVTAIIPEGIRGETGDVVVLPKGAHVFGTIQHALTNGLDRLAVLWQSITTPVLYDSRGMPHQFRVTVNSPAASELGETGVDGEVDRHYLKKIGGILGLSLIQGSIQYAVQSAQKDNGGTTINLDSFQNGGNQAANSLLESWIAIPDVMHRNQGLSCGIYIVRDLDMRGAYQLTQRYRP